MCSETFRCSSTLPRLHHALFVAGDESRQLVSTNLRFTARWIWRALKEFQRGMVRLSYGLIGVLDDVRLVEMTDSRMQRCRLLNGTRRKR